MAFAAQVAEDCRLESFPSVKALAARQSQLPIERLVVVPIEKDVDDRYAFRALRRLRKAAPEVPILAVAEAGDVSAAAEAVRDGANDFLVLGSQLEQRVATVLGKMHSLLRLLHRTRTLSHQNAELRQNISVQFQIEGNSPQINTLIKRIEKVAAVPRPLLVVGERGTGKELVARAVHAAAGDPNRPIVIVNCAAFSDSLLESELFGHERGAFTGASEPREGRFAQADGGTLFLDEIGNMSLPFQQKILRVVEYGTYRRIGGHSEQTTSARVIAATNVDLQKRIRDGKFLSDLYDRLAFEVIDVPPLRDRTGDIELLARLFLDRFALEIPTLGGKRLAKSALDVLDTYHFPGNVRELKNIIERAACRDTTNEITPEDLGMLNPRERIAPCGTFRDRVEAFQRQLLADALRQSDHNQAAAARALGLTYDQFRYYARKFAV